MGMISCLYECQLMHHRLAPKRHKFVYKLFMFYLDLTELDVLTKRLFFFSKNKLNLFNFNEKDHLPSSSKPLKERIADYLADHNIYIKEMKTMILTCPRILGYVFNPVSFYFCFEPDGTPVCAIAEVSNTFREMKPFLLTKESLTHENTFKKIAPKHFYVSPFIDLDVHFDFKLSIPDGRLEIHIDDWQEGERILLASLTGSRTVLNNRNLFWFTFKYPFLTLKIIFLIHWNAFLLYLKGIPYHKKAANPLLQKDLYRPHISVSGRTL